MSESDSAEPRQGAAMAALSAGIAIVMHAFVAALLLVVAMLAVRVGMVYDDMELELAGGVKVARALATSALRVWYVLVLPMLLDVGIVFWLAAKPSRRWLLPLWNYLWLGGALVVTTMAFGVMVSPLFRMMVTLE
jgi:hypothetical protein